MLDAFLKGGVIMYPILLCSIVALAVVIERMIVLLRRNADADELLEDVRYAVDAGRIIEALQIAKRSRSPLSNMIVAALTSMGKPRTEVEEMVRTAGEQELRRLEKNLPILELVVTIAPMLGLLGTVVGIIKSFNVLGATAGLTDPAVLSIGIAEALITTAAGLIVAIPTQAMYTYLNGLIERHVSVMNRKSLEIVSLAVSNRSDVE
ncbi:MAG: MotA/TolQ/ExbB proton channel family protein [Bacillota bacterium]|jgi:biopolymer transport protein ExbB|nr:MotA/TolQ/ExbB proton channel family protein [Bacillota bacterium]HPZ53510.1 MotA/TolQ/ExbB proton channel family protein [Bacillota bacterium]HQD17071.1 MotA/TolQ/ExbB proton channel family protein [Bacillota bacterium]